MPSHSTWITWSPPGHWIEAMPFPACNDPPCEKHLAPGLRQRLMVRSWDTSWPLWEYLICLTINWEYPITYHQETKHKYFKSINFMGKWIALPTCPHGPSATPPQDTLSRGQPLNNWLQSENLEPGLLKYFIPWDTTEKGNFLVSGNKTFLSTSLVNSDGLR